MYIMYGHMVRVFVYPKLHALLASLRLHNKIFSVKSLSEGNIAKYSTSGGICLQMMTNDNRRKKRERVWRWDDIKVRQSFSVEVSTFICFHNIGRTQRAFWLLRILQSMLSITRDIKNVLTQVTLGSDGTISSSATGPTQ